MCVYLNLLFWNFDLDIYNNYSKNMETFANTAETNFRINFRISHDDISQIIRQINKFCFLKYISYIAWYMIWVNQSDWFRTRYFVTRVIAESIFKVLETLSKCQPFSLYSALAKILTVQFEDKTVQNEDKT